MWKSANGENNAAADADAAGAATNGAKGPGSLMAKKLIVVVVAGLVLAGGGLGAATFLGRGTAKPEELKVEAPLTFEFTEIVVNVDGTRGTRVLRCVLDVEVNNTKALEEVRLRELVFRDAIINILRSKTLDDLEYPGESAVKRQIRDRLNRMMVKGSIVEVYLVDFLIH